MFRGESVLLCVYECEILRPFYARQELYRTEKGSFFLVSKGGEIGTQVQVMDETAAFRFMDSHTAGIITGNYDRVFGKPEKA